MHSLRIWTSAARFSSMRSRLPLGTPTVNQTLDIELPQGKNLATYVWIDGTGENVREKTRTMEKVPESIKEKRLRDYCGIPYTRDFPEWQFDGSSTGQALKGEDSDIYLQPVASYPDPFFGKNHSLVLCETKDKNRVPTATNHRSPCAEVMEKVLDQEVWFGMEQEYLLLDMDGHPLGWPKHGYPAPQGPYYCGVGATKVFGREIVNAHYRACLAAGLQIFGINAEFRFSEVTPGQWEFQLGTCVGIEMGDQLWMARYLLHRVAEQFGIGVTFHPKPSVTMGDWNGAGCHCNFSTKEMRAEGGLKAIEAAMPKLAATHKEAITCYDPNNGMDNQHRLTGKHETSSVEKFSWGVANRASSVRIPRGVAAANKGYLEDRRPSSNCDPYQVTRLIAKSILL